MQGNLESSIHAVLLHAHRQRQIQVRLCSALPLESVLLSSSIQHCQASTTLLQARRRRRTGHRSVCESRLVLSGASSCLAGSLCACVPRLVCGLPPRLRVPGVSPLIARARLLTRCYCWLAVGPKAKRPIYRSWLDRSLLACSACRCWVS